MLVVHCDISHNLLCWPLQFLPTGYYAYHFMQETERTNLQMFSFPVTTIFCSHHDHQILVAPRWMKSWKYFLLAGLNVEGCTYASMSLLLVYRLTKCSNMAMNYESMTLKVMNNWHLKYADPVECEDPKKADKLITKLDCNILAHPRIYIIFLTVFLYICR